MKILNSQKFLSVGMTPADYRTGMIHLMMLLEKHSEGLIALSGCLAGEVSSALMRGDYNGAKETALWYKELFGKDLPGGKSIFTVKFEVKNAAELDSIRNKLLNIRDVVGSRRGQN